MPTADLGFYYRYRETYDYTPSFNGGFYLNASVKIILDKFPITKKTPKGAYVLTDKYPNPEKLILDHWNRKYAHPTEKKAQLAYLKRKQSQITIVQQQLFVAREAYAEACNKFGLPQEIRKYISENKVYPPEQDGIDDQIPY